MKLLKLEQITGEEELARSIMTDDYKELLSEGARLKKEYIPKLRELGITEVYLAGFDGELHEVDKLIEDHKKWIEKYPEDYEVKPETREDWIAYLTSDKCEDRYYTYSQWGEYEWSDYLESFAQRFETPSGDKMIAIGYYGNDY